MSGQLFQTTLLTPVEGVLMAWAMAVLSVCVIIVLFLCLNRPARQAYFSLWTVAWMFYAVHLAAALEPLGIQEPALLLLIRRACIGISALYLFAGSLHLAHRARPIWEVRLGAIFLLLWSAVATFLVQDRLWATVPVFVLLALVAGYTGSLYWRQQHQSLGTRLLGVGFILWGVHLLAFPFLSAAPLVAAAAYLTSVLLALVIIIGMATEHQAAFCERSYRALFDQASDAVLLLEVGTLRVLEANRAAQRLMGRQAPELVGQAFLDLCGESSRQSIARLAAPERAANLGAPLVDCLVLQPDGTAVSCEATASLLQEVTGPVLQLSLRDVSQRLRAEQELRLHAAALEAATNAIVISDATGRITWVNAAFTQLTGYPAEEARGMNVWFLKTDQSDAPLYQQLWSTVRYGRMWHGRVINQRKDGTTYLEEMTIVPVRDLQGRISNLIAIKQEVGAAIAAAQPAGAASLAAAGEKSS